jgi:hypothetical protein
MDGRGRALENVFIERLWRSVKYEYVYLHAPVTEMSYGKEFTTTSPVTTITDLISHSITLPLHRYTSRIRKKYKISEELLHLISHW